MRLHCGDSIAYFRRKQGIKQHVLAAQLNMTRQNLSAIELNKISIDAHKLEQFSQCLGVPISALKDGKITIANALEGFEADKTMLTCLKSALSTTQEALEKSLDLNQYLEQEVASLKLKLSQSTQRTH